MSSINLLRVKDLLLISLSEKRELNSSQIAEMFDLATQGILKVNRELIYPWLKHLRVQGYITSRWQEEKNNLKTEYYQITDEGLKVFKQSQLIRESLQKLAMGSEKNCLVSVNACNSNPEIDKLLEALNSEDIDVRIETILELESFLLNTTEFPWIIVEYLAAFIRKNYSISKYAKSTLRMTEDCQMALKAIAKIDQNLDFKEKLIDLSKVYFGCAQLERADLTRVDFRRSNFYGVQFKGINFQGANFTGANFTEGRFERCDFRGADFRAANLQGAIFWESDFQGINLERYNLSHANFMRANFRGANLEKCNLFKTDLYGVNLKEANLEGVNFTQTILKAANLKRANLERANFCSVNLLRANLKEANLEGANLEGANLEGANLEGANLEGANLEGANLEGANVDKKQLEPITV